MSKKTERVGLLIQNKKICLFFLLSLLLIFASEILAKSVLTERKMVFEKCLEVIQLSSLNLGVDPKFEVKTKDKSIAHFKMIDGTLTIECDGISGELIVSTTSQMEN